jgi:diaminohydroxyphosphoribosylaminopyrimidine deaminase/5-amino-6-(5-phosphoribosylamino)uracil reductase
MSVTVKNKPLMQRAIELARRGFGEVEPNPMVGCVIARDDEIIGEGWHKRFGDAHAEINALADCKRRGHSPVDARLIVTLEPCCHTGKTPPCTQAIIASGIKKVIVGMEDPTEKVAGKGISQLRKADVDVKVGLCQKDCELLNPGFLKYAKTGIPWVIAKWAQTIDGKIWRDEAGTDRWITGEKARKDVHKLRRSCQAILVGAGTVAADDPLLTARPSRDQGLLRVVLDSKLGISLQSQLVKTAAQESLLVVTTKAGNAQTEKISAIEKTGGHVLVVDSDKAGYCSLDAVIKELGDQGVQRLLVEGGARVIASFLRQKKADQAMIYIAPKIFGGTGCTLQDLKPTAGDGLTERRVQLFGEDIKISGLLRF